MFKDKFQFNRERLELVYSVFILVVIPLLMMLNTLILTMTIRRNFDSELRRKADLANAIVASSVKDSLNDPVSVQAKVELYKNSNEEISQLIIAVPGERSDAMEIIASTNDSLIGENFNDVRVSAAIIRKQSVAQLLTAPDRSRQWSVVSPVLDGDTVSGVVVTDISLKYADALVGQTLSRSIVIVGVTVIIVMLLLSNHFKFVQYALLFRKLKEVDQLKNDFLSVATHELKAPMAVIKGDIENLYDGLTGSVDEKGKQSLKGVFAEIERLNSLVNDLLNVARIEQGRVSYSLEPTDLREITEKVCTEFLPKAQAKGLELNYQKPANPVVAMIDKGRFTEIMTNLVDNAIKYSRQGSIVVSHKDADNKARISVRDSGIGMTAASRERLFSRFYRIQNAETKGIAGTGLGLWIIKQYVEHMNGVITVDSLEGVGSEFIIEFPLTKQ